MVGGWGKNFDDYEGSFSFGGEFWVGNGAFQVLGLQLYLVSFFEGFEILMVSGEHDLVDKFMRGEGFISGSVEGF